MQRGFSPILLFILIAAALAGYFAYSNKHLSLNITLKPTPPARACSPDTKTCSDGTVVSRVPPNCNFAPCPSPESSSSADISNWKTYTNNQFNFSIEYPPNMEIKNEWNGKQSLVEIFNAGQRVILLYITPNPVNAYGNPIKTIQDTFEGSDSPPIFYTQQSYPAVRLETTYSDGKSIIIHVLKNNALWTMYNFNNIKDQGKLDTIKQILSTFKFLP